MQLQLTHLLKSKWQLNNMAASSINEGLLDKAQYWALSHKLDALK